MASAVDKRSSSRAVRAALLTLGLACSICAQPALASGTPKGAGGAVAPSGGGDSSRQGSAESCPDESCPQDACLHRTQGNGQDLKRGVRTGDPLLNEPSPGVCAWGAPSQGGGLQKGMVVAFPRSYGARIARNSPTAHIASSQLGVVVHVPRSAHSGRIMIVLSHGRHSNSYGPIQVVSHALHPPTPPVPAPLSSVTPSGSAFDGQGMWIWYVSQSDRRQPRRRSSPRHMPPGWGRCS